MSEHTIDPEPDMVGMAEKFMADLCDDDYHRCAVCGYWLGTREEFDRKTCDSCAKKGKP